MSAAKETGKEAFLLAKLAVSIDRMHQFQSITEEIQYFSTTLLDTLRELTGDRSPIHPEAFMSFELTHSSMYHSIGYLIKQAEGVLDEYA